MGILYIEQEHYNEFKKLIEVICPYKLHVFKAADLYFDSKWLHNNKFNCKEKFVRFFRDNIKVASYPASVYQKIVEIEGHIEENLSVVTQAQFKSFNMRAVAFGSYYYEVNEPFLNIIAISNKINDLVIKRDATTDITEDIIDLYSYILLYKALTGEYVDITGPIMYSVSLECLDFDAINYVLGSSYY